MARQNRNNVDYFPHPTRNGKKMTYIKEKYKHIGYSVWYQLLEELGHAEYHHLNLSEEIDLMLMSTQLMTDEETLKNIITDLVKLKVFDKELWEQHSVVYCQKFVNDIQDAYKRRNNNCITLEELYQQFNLKGKPEPVKGKPKEVENPQIKEKDNKQKQIKQNKIDVLCLAFCPFYLDDDFQEVWVDFEKVREKKKASKSERSYKSLIKKLIKYSGGDKIKAIKIVEKSADSGWSDLYELNGSEKTPTKSTTNR